MMDRELAQLRRELKPNPHFGRQRLLLLSGAVLTVAAILAGFFLFLWLLANREGQVENMRYPLVETELCSFSYTGKTRGGTPHGEGTLTVTWSDGAQSRYIGNFRWGYPQGKGTYHYTDGTRHTSTQWSWKETAADKVQSFAEPVSGGVGMYAGNAICGIYFSQGDIRFGGEWYAGKLNGYGQILYESRDEADHGNDISAKYFADFGEGYYFWKELQMESRGISLYKGYVKDGEICGYGEITYSNFDQFTGVLDYGMLPTMGIYFWNTGSLFMGAFDKNGYPYYGVYLPKEETLSLLGEVKKWENKDEEKIVALDPKTWSYDKEVGENGYTGMLLEGKKEGVGTVYAVPGIQFLANVLQAACYQGEFREDQCHGVGIQYWTEDRAGSCFVGNFESGAIKGEGQYLYGMDTSGKKDLVSGDDWCMVSEGVRDSAGNAAVECLYLGMKAEQQRMGYGLQYYLAPDNTWPIGAYAGSWRDDRPYGHGVFGYGPDTEDPAVDKEYDARHLISGTWSWTDSMQTEDGVYAGMLCEGIPGGWGALKANDGSLLYGIWDGGVLAYPMEP